MELDPCRCETVRGLPIGGDPADAAGVGDREPGAGPLRRPVLEPHRAELERLVAAQADLTLAELQDRLQRRCGVVVALSTLHGTLHRLGLRHKKRA